MSSDEMTPDSEFNELSDQELDEVAGGLSFSISAARFSQTNLSFGQVSKPGLGCGSTETAFESQSIESAAFQITVIDATTEDLKILGELFGDASAIEGSA
ncbi:CTB family bacteriocin [Phormidesmis priestleyi]